MTCVSDTVNLSDFRENAAAHLHRLAETGRAEVLTVDGEARGIVMSPSAFDRLLEYVEELETAASIQRGLADVAAGRTRPAREAIEEIAAEFGLTLDRARS